MNQVLPEGVAWIYATLDLGTLGPDEFERIFDSYPRAAKTCAEIGAQFTLLTGSVVFEHQYEKGLKMAKRVQEVTGIPTVISPSAHINGLKKVGAKKVVIVSPLAQELNETRARILKDEGMEVLNMKALGLKHNREVQSLPPYASYRLAMEAIREAPEADTINIVCPGWAVMGTTELLERDSGKVVVSSLAGELFTALSALNLKGPIKGYGKLLEML